MKDELPEYAKKYGGDTIKMTVEEEAEFLMQCNEMENMPNIPEALEEFDKMGIPMYVLSNSGFTAEALSIVLEKLGIRKYFKRIWSSTDYDKIKPCRDFFDMAINNVLKDNPAIHSISDTRELVGIVKRMMINENCPCKKKKCERHGKCDECRKHHAESKRQRPVYCEKKTPESTEGRE